MSVAPVRAIRVLLVDDQPLVRSGLRVLMADTADLEVVGEAGTGTEGVRLAAEPRPDVVVMDIRMPGMDGIEATGLIAAGDALIAPGVTRRLIADFVRVPGPVASAAPEARAPRPATGITEREREVLTLVGRGLSNGEMAEELFISTATATSHVSRLFTKLGARDRVQLVITAYEMGLVAAPR
ncbi:response regulator transcription factor [Streptomyces sp. NPDC048331]|uniref:response regulator transcription factor n=1 Tax=Streptomyces sp. NPDC048331 TaxID=3365534 RepID=UPI0037222A5F